MALFIMYAAVRLLLDAVIVRGSAEASLRGRQLRMLERQTGRPRWQTADRLTLAAQAERGRIRLRAALIPRPETLLRNGVFRPYTWRVSPPRRRSRAVRRVDGRQRYQP
jgi:hypothetical protein